MHFFSLPCQCSFPQRESNFLFFKIFRFVICGDRVNVVSPANKNLYCQSLILPLHFGLDTRTINLYIPSFRNNVGLLILSVEYRSRARKPCRKNLFPVHCLLIKYKEYQVIRSGRTFFFLNLSSF